MKRFLVALTLAVLLMAGFQSLAWAQGFRVNGGIDLQPLRPQAGFTITVERPAFTLFGARWGPIATLKARTDFATADVELLTGVGGAINLPSTNWAVKVKLLLDTQLQTGRPFTVGPDFQLTVSTTF